MSQHTLTPDGPVPWLLSFRGPKDEEVNRRIKLLPGVTWDPDGKRWLVPIELRSIVKMIADPMWAGMVGAVYQDTPQRIWARKDSPPQEVFKGRPLVTEAERFCNPNSQRTQRMVLEFTEQLPNNPLLVTSFDMHSDLKKAFALLELAYPGRFGRWPDRYSGSWRFLETYSNWEERAGHRLWYGMNPENREEYLKRLRCCAYIDEPEPVEETPTVAAKGLFE